MTGNTTIAGSPKKFDVPQASSSPTGFTAISAISTMNTYDNVNLNVKALQVTPSCTVPTGKQKQDVIIADSTGTIKLTLWGNEIGKLEANTSYQLLRMTICTYNGYKYVNFPKEGGSFTTIDDIGEVATNDNHLNVSDNIQDAEICGVSGLFKYKSCLKCKSKAEVTSAKFARCTNPSCKMLQKVGMAKETFSAIVAITAPSITDKEVHIFEAELRKIVHILLQL